MFDSPFFDPDYFDPEYWGDGFETQQDESTSEVAGTEHYECGRCGFHYPRAKVIVQEGLIVCRGSGTNRCFDEPGAQAERMRKAPTIEEPPKPLPVWTGDL